MAMITSRIVNHNIPYLLFYSSAHTDANIISHYDETDTPPASNIHIDKQEFPTRQESPRRLIEKKDFKCKLSSQRGVKNATF